MEEVEDDNKGEAMMENMASGVLKQREPADKAVKSDDLAVPVHLWDNHIMAKYRESNNYEGEGVDLQDPIIRWKLKKGLKGLQRAALRFWKWKVHLDFHRWVEVNKDGWNEKRRESY